MQVTDNVIATSEVFSVMKDGIIICTPDNKYIKLDKEVYFNAMKRIEPAVFVLDYEEDDTEVCPVEVEQTEDCATKEYYLLVTDNTTGKTIYSRELVGKDSLEISDHIPEIEETTSFSLDPKSIQPGLGQINVTINAVMNPTISCWDSKDYFFSQNG